MPKAVQEVIDIYDMKIPQQKLMQVNVNGGLKCHIDPKSHSN